MGLFDVFSKGGKYFGKAIAPRCEYCEFGKRASNGAKVLCTKKGLVDAGYHCPKFIYSPLKRIPVKQMNIVGFLEGDYDEKNFDEEPTTTETSATYEKKEAEKPAEAPKAEPKKTEEKPAASSESESKPAIDAKTAADDLASLAAAADAAGEYVADAADAPAEEETPAPAAMLDEM